jgi:hypothetical protein
MAGQLVQLRSDGQPARFRLGSEAFRIGRDPSMDLVLDSPRVSRQHARIEPEGSGYALVDLGSPNGTTLNGEPVRGRATLEAGDLIGVAAAATLRYEQVREVRPARLALSILAVSLAALAAAGSWWFFRQRELEQQVFAPALAHVEAGLLVREQDPTAAKAHLKSAIGILYQRGLLDDVERGSVFDEGLRRLEARRAPPVDLRALFHELEARTVAAAPLSGEPPCRLDAGDPAGFDPCLRAGIRWLLGQLHQSGTDVPEEFVRQVGGTLLREHGFLSRTLRRGEPYRDMMRSELERKRMPPLLHYIAAIESGYRNEARSHAGAVGLWQFMPRTANDYGLRVGDGVDERQDPEKSTQAAAQYLQHLVFEFGSDALLLALAGYNFGQERVRGRLKQLEDPFHDRSYWRLVERGLLPAETAAYVARFTAAALAGEAGLPPEETLRAAGY